MRLFVGVTDFDWFRFLASRPGIDEVNFWQPSGRVRFGALEPGGVFLFKLHSPRNFIVGGGVFAHWSALPVSLAWEAFGEKNGTASLQEMRVRLARYRHAEDARVDYTIGCVLLEQPFFLEERDWIPAPADWSGNIVRGKGYDSTVGEGRRLWERLAVMGAMAGSVVPASAYEPAVAAERYGGGRSSIRGWGRGNWRCAVTVERTLPVWEAAHIRPYGASGPHDPRNGLLLRSDLHTLFDRGCATVTPELRFEVSRRIREEFENGREYYRLHGAPVRQPSREEWAPSREYLDWHARGVSGVSLDKSDPGASWHAPQSALRHPGMQREPQESNATKATTPDWRNRPLRD